MAMVKDKQKASTKFVLEVKNHEPEKKTDRSEKILFS